MTGRIAHFRAGRRVRTFLADESGASLVEFALVVTLFLFLLLAMIDFGRIGYTWVGANKATQLAARIAAVRPPACAGVPTTNVRGTSGASPEFGALCRAGTAICAAPATVTCVGNAANPTALEIFNAVRPLVPETAINQMTFSYAADPNLGFLGGPYVPMVTVEFTGVQFRFISRLGAVSSAMTGQGSTLGATLNMPGMSVSLPGEDLALGTEG
jgi:Flp pilus assembly protein TadG